MIRRLMERFRESRLDIRLGLVAAPLAVLGLASSVVSGNEDLFGAHVSTKDQGALLAWAIAVLAITLGKAWRSWRRN